VCVSRSVCCVAAIVFVGNVGLERAVSFDFGGGDSVPCPCLVLCREQGQLESRCARVLVGCAVGVQVAVHVAVDAVETVVVRYPCGVGVELVAASVLLAFVATAPFVCVVSADGLECLEFVEGTAGVVIDLEGEVLAKMEEVSVLLEDVAGVVQICAESLGAVWRVWVAVLSIVYPLTWRMDPLLGVGSEGVDADGEKTGVECPVGMGGVAPGPSCGCYLEMVCRCSLREGVCGS
jgi:hypothetical protein